MLSGVNFFTTIVKMRTKGMTMERLPIFVWGMMATAVLGLYAFPFFIVAEFLQLGLGSDGKQQRESCKELACDAVHVSRL